MRGNSTLDTDDTSFLVEDTAAVSKIFIADMRGSKVTLTRQQGFWMVNNEYRVRPEFMEVLMNTIRRISVAYPVAEAAHNQVIKELATDNKKVMLYNQQGDLIKSYYVGGSTTDNLGTYMMIDGSNKPMVCVIPGFDGVLTIRFLTDEEEIRSRNIFSYSTTDLKTISINYTQQPDSSFEINLLGPDSFFISQPIHHNTKRLSDKNFNLYSYLQLFRFINAEAYENSYSKKDSILKTTPFALIKVTDRNEQTITVPCYRKPVDEKSAQQYDNKGNKLPFDSDRFFVATNNGKDFLLVQQFHFGRLLKSFSFFMRGEVQSAH